MDVFLTFHQTYEPVLGSIFLSALVAGLPLYALFVTLAVLRLPAWICAITAMLTAALLGWIVWGMPLDVTIGSATEGMAFGLWPISWIVLNAVFFHNLTVASGDFDVIKRALSRLTTDRRLQALLVAFSFGALIEGIAGFGAPVAISASILASLGFEPVTAAVLALLANTAPVAFGSIGIPVVTLGRLVAPVLGHTDPTSTTMALSAMVGRQLPLFSIIIPAYLIVVLAGWRRMREVLPAVLVTGVSFAVVQFLVSNLVGPELTDIIAALVSMGCLAALLRFWRPREVWQFAHESAATAQAAQPRRVMGGSDLPARGVAVGRSPLDVADPPSRIVRRQPRVQAVPAAVDRARPGQGPPGLQVPVLELLLARHVHARQEGTAGVGGAEREADRGQGGPLQQSVQLGLPRRRGHAGAVRIHRRVRRHAARGRALELFHGVCADRPSARAPDRDDLVHPRHRLRHELLRHDLEPRHRLLQDRALISVRLRVPGLAGRVPDRQRHVVEHSVRAAAGADRTAAAQREPDPDRRHQLVRWRDGQDDQPAEPVGRRGRREQGRLGRRDLPASDRLQPDPHQRDGHPGDDRGVRDPGNSAADTVTTRPTCDEALSACWPAGPHVRRAG
ncbi:MAG: L-lactate permease [Chloroflexi bacterium]|nr:MAG: L-lactate permease [Chloroflexota bacterium]